MDANKVCSDRRSKEDKCNYGISNSADKIYTTQLIYYRNRLKKIEIIITAENLDI